MKLTVAIPGKSQDQTIQEFRIRPGSKQVTAVLIIDGKRTPVTFDMQAAVDNATATQKNVIRGFFKKMSESAYEAVNAALTLDVDPANIEGEVFDDA